MKYSLSNKIYDWLDERTGIKKFITEKIEYPIPDHVNFLYCFGGLSFFIILLQIITGFIMLFFYVPRPEEALKSVNYISTEVPLGWLLRNSHRWGATVLIAMIFSHMASVFFHKAFQRPRELNWVSGLCMFFIVYLFSITGIILPWDWKSYWALTLWSDYVATWPLFGHIIKDLILANFAVGRSFVIHIWLLPFFTIILLWFHFKMVRRHGISGGL